MPKTHMRPLNFMFACLLFGSGTHAESVRIIDRNGDPIAGAWVSLVNTNSTPLQDQEPLYIDQRAIAFDPVSLGVPIGTPIIFRNSDTVTHHVFSFSPSAPSELEKVVRPRQELDPTKFNKPGVVRLGCNIHDQMVSHIYIAQSDRVWQTDIQGVAVLNVGISGEQTLEVWTPAMGLDPVRKSITLNSDGAVDVQVDVSGPGEQEPRRSRRRRY